MEVHTTPFVVAVSPDAEVIGPDYVIGSWQNFTQAIQRMLSGTTTGDWVLDLDVRNGE